MAKEKYQGAFVDHGDTEYEYDGGPANFTGEIASPHINSVADGIMKAAFPDGVEAFQKQRQNSEK